MVASSLEIGLTKISFVCKTVGVNVKSRVEFAIFTIKQTAELTQFLEENGKKPLYDIGFKNRPLTEAILNNSGAICAPT